MNMTWLEDFLALASSGNFSRAADERHMTQPAFSRRIRALEEWLGVVLFDRSSQPAVLTETGVWFRTVAEDILARIARVPDEARAVADASSSTLKFAATHALSFSFLPAWLRGLETQVVVGPIQLVSDVLQQCESLMLNGRTQFVLCHGHEHAPGRLDNATHANIKVGADALIPVSKPDASGLPMHRLGAGRGSAGGMQPRGHRGVHGESVHVAAATRTPVLSYSTESGMGRILRAVRGGALDEARIETVFTAHLASVLRTMALDGRGVAWLPRSLVADDLQAGRLVEAADAMWQVDLDIKLFRAAEPMSRAAEAFWSAALAASRDNQ